MVIHRLSLALAALSLTAGCAAGSRPGGRERQIAPYAEPGRVAATERAFARMARDEGTWTAFREYATADALWPSPEFSLVQQDLAGVADPAEPILWGPEQVWSSCDGSFAVSTGGAVHPGGLRTRFLTVWQRQDNGDYRWVLDQGLPDDGAQMAPEMIAATAAQCPPEQVRRAAPARRGEQWSTGRSDDGTLAWETALASDCSRTVVVRTLQEGALAEVFRREAPPPPVPANQPAPACG